MDETTVESEIVTKGLQPVYDRIVEQLGSLDTKAQALVSMEGLLLALVAVFSSSITNNLAAKAATLVSLLLIIASALCSLLVLRIRWGTSILAKAANLERGFVNYRQWRDHKLKLHHAALVMLAAGLLGLMFVVSLILLWR